MQFIPRTNRSAAVALICAIALSAVALLATVGRASAQSAPSPITVTVPVADVTADGVSLRPKGPMGDLFEESYRPSTPGVIQRQDAVGVGTAQGHGVFVGTVNLKRGQIIYAGSTTDQDDNTYAVLGGTGGYIGAHGVLITKTISRTQVQITIQLS